MRNEKTVNEQKAELNLKAKALREQAAQSSIPKMRKLYAQAVKIETVAMHLGETPAY